MTLYEYFAGKGGGFGMTVGECSLYDELGELLLKLEKSQKDRMGTFPKKKVQRLIKKEGLHIRKLWKLMRMEMECYLGDYGSGKRRK